MAALSPDGGRLAVTRWAGIRGTIAVYERDRRILSMLTPEPGSHLCAVWSPDGRRIAFTRFAERYPSLASRTRTAAERSSPHGSVRGRRVPELMVS